MNKLFFNMTGVWIVLSSRWGFADVQAAVNVVISAIGVIGIWAFSRFWWQQGTKRVLAKPGMVPLSSLFTFTGAGEGWDLITLLRHHLFLKENWHLLFQLIVVLTITLVTMLAGPLARISLRSGYIFQPAEMDVIHAKKGSGAASNLILAPVYWISTIESMARAGFPYDRLMDVVPSLKDPWVYQEQEWDSSWRANCNFTDETRMDNLVATGNSTLGHPLSAFPALRSTMDQSWLNESLYRINTHWSSSSNFSRIPEVKQWLGFVLISTDPRIEDQMNRNRNPLRLSITALHFQNITLKIKSRQATGNFPIGPVGRGRYSRTECLITRKEYVEDENRIPWPWTNATSSIVSGLMETYGFEFLYDVHNGETPLLSGRDLFRFYQAYMASISIQEPHHTSMKLSTRQSTVELSIVTLALILFVFIMSIWSALRFMYFMLRHKSEIEELYIPDAKLEWMVHAVKNSQHTSDELKGSNRVRFQNAVLGSNNQNQCPPGAARVYSSRVIFSDQIIGTKPADVVAIGT